MRDVVSILSECSDTIGVGSICTFVRNVYAHGTVTVDAIKRTAYPDDPNAAYVHMPATSIDPALKDGDRCFVVSIEDGVATVIKDRGQ